MSVDIIQFTAKVACTSYEVDKELCGAGIRLPCPTFNICMHIYNTTQKLIRS